MESAACSFTWSRSEVEDDGIRAIRVTAGARNRAAGPFRPSREQRRPEALALPAGRGRNGLGIDHGLCFTAYTKLRTVLWQFVGGPVHEALVADLALLRRREPELRIELEELLEQREINALLRRIDMFITDPIYPVLKPHRNIPYGRREA